MARKVTIRTNIITNILLVVSVVAVALLTLQYYFSKRLALEAARQHFTETAAKLGSVLESRELLARETLRLVAHYPGIDTFNEKENPREAVQLLATPLEHHDDLYALYIGYPDGRLFEVANLHSAPGLYHHYHAPSEARWILIRVYESGGRKIRRFDYYSADFRHLGSSADPTDYDATRRPWYRGALDAHGVVRSDPYMFYNLQRPGITYSLHFAPGRVLAMDVTVGTLQRHLERMKFAPGSLVTLLGRDGKLIASSGESRSPQFRHVERIFTRLMREGKKAEIVSYRQKGREYLAMVLPLYGGAEAQTWLGVSIDEWELLAPYLEMLRYELIAALLVLLLMLPVVRLTTRRIVRPIKRLMEENTKVKERRFDEVERIETDIIELDQLSRSLVEMAESIRRYQEEQKELLDSFIRLIADAIDAKSPYTAGHCKRVPEIAKMLLEEACRSEEGEFAGFRMEGEEAWEEFERGAWLHDCGKITTPEYVVDKATKLETIHNRIHEIRTRFEVLWRDREIDYYKALLRGEDRRRLEEKLRREHARLKDEFAFIARINLGGETLDMQSRERILRIAGQTWLRHFDDRLGLSEAELRRLEGVERPELPVTEPLLADRPEHRIPREGFDMEAYHREGFTMPVPELLYDRGELYNLTVERGTLTPEERFKINEHAILTLRMLERLPLPENMRRIPEYAGTHHEQLNGRGYPRSLKAEQLSIPDRVMAIADIFEALTATDRPYKEGKRLSAALEIMARMAAERHIDPEVFALFVHSGVYRRYAEEVLQPNQVDTVDEEELLRTVPA